MSKTKKFDHEFTHEFTIDESRWRHGGIADSADVNALVNPDGTMCCLGFFGKSCGIRKSDMLYKQTPEFLINKAALPIKFKRLLKEDYKSMEDNKICVDLISENDSAGPHKERKARIKKLFAEIGVKVNFVKGVPK